MKENNFSSHFHRIFMIIFHKKINFNYISYLLDFIHYLYATSLQARHPHVEVVSIMSARSPRFDEDDYETIRNELQGKLLSSLNTENKRDQLIATSWNLLENAFHIELKRYQDTVNMLKKKVSSSPRDPSSTVPFLAGNHSKRS